MTAVSLQGTRTKAIALTSRRCGARVNTMCCVWAGANSLCLAQFWGVQVPVAKAMVALPTATRPQLKHSTGKSKKGQSRVLAFDSTRSKLAEVFYEPTEMQKTLVTVPALKGESVTMYGVYHCVAPVICARCARLIQSLSAICRHFR